MIEVVPLQGSGYRLLITLSCRGAGLLIVRLCRSNHPLQRLHVCLLRQCINPNHVRIVAAAQKYSNVNTTLTI
jgi:hypothetical protein